MLGFPTDAKRLGAGLRPRSKHALLLNLIPIWQKHRKPRRLIVVPQVQRSLHRLLILLRDFFVPLVAERLVVPCSSPLSPLSAPFIHSLPSPGLLRLIVPGPTATISSSLSLSPTSSRTGMLNDSSSNSLLAGSIVKTSTVSSSRSNRRL